LEATVAQMVTRLNEQDAKMAKMSKQLAAASSSGGELEMKKLASNVAANP
jgi:hypothetical protein